MAQSASGRRVCVVVVGDVGRSPRMQYHAMSLAQSGCIVDIVGYGGSQPIQELLDAKDVNIRYMEDIPTFSDYVPKLLAYALKVVWQTFALLSALIALPRPDCVLVQVPPSLPVLSVLWFYRLLRSVHLIIDWHNYGHTILALNLRKNHFAVRFYKWFEMSFGARADNNFCVTTAMQADLLINHGINAVVLFDRPPKQFQPIDLECKHRLFLRLSKEYRCFANDSEKKSAFTEEVEDGTIVDKPGRPVLLVSSTSWTEDEDISMLFAALEEYDICIRNGVKKLPNVVCIITGKGPLKEYYAKQISIMKFQHVKICLPWLSAEDYPRMLASADLGVSLHTSSSGLDLPMKVVDMFGCGVPVLALHFNCINELVKHDENGLVFHDKHELSEQLQDILETFPKLERLEGFKENLKQFQRERWEKNWQRVAKPLFQ